MKRSELILMMLQIPVDLAMLVFASLGAFQLRFAPLFVAWRPVVFTMTRVEFLSKLFPVFVAWIVIFAFAGLYSTDPNRKLSRDLGRVFFACSTGLAVIAVYILFTQQVFDSRFLVLAGWALSIIFVSVGRILMRGVKGLLYRAGIGLRRIVIIGNDALGQMMRETIASRRELGFSVLGVYPAFSAEVEATLLETRPDEILFTNARAKEDETLRAIDFATDHHIVFKYSADLFATYTANMTVQPIAGVPIVELRPTRLDGWGRVTKRLFDIVMSIVCIILVSPVLLISALVILFETGRPIIYKNERVGIRGRRFLVYKFRSMYQKDSTGAQFGGDEALKKEQELLQTNNTKEGPVYKIANDPRITPFGRFIRRVSIDELPQFFNVLKGEMSIVGPRPHQPREVAQYEKHHRKVFTLKPGITGLAQISGRSDLSFEDEVRLDVLYIERWSLLLDIIIFLKTPFILFRKRKAL